jgi:pimeloyl-ACP methyl ester carboxylesterase
LLDIACATAGRNDRIFLTGHSLGGGIAQIVAARRGVAAVAISAPAVTAVEGVAAAWMRSKAPIACLQVRNDPINQTVSLGGWLGRCFLLPSPRTGLEAHSIAGTRAELSPQGPFSTLGARDPFAP